MFEKSLEDATAIVWVDQKVARLWGQHGVPLQPGGTPLAYHQAVDITTRMARLFPSIPKRDQPRCRAMLNAIKNAFGPEFWERHP